ncbi:MAG: hypothetical protein HY901_03375, partial [Deltaproteobacteria bacterium]|nr:hypothetical protein [Deltaproteobacteria bacterium]
GSPATCDVECRFVEKQAPDCTSFDGCCPAGCAAQGDADCTREKPAVILVVSKAFAHDAQIRARIDRYEEEHQLYSFHEVLFDQSAQPISSMEDRGSEPRRNWVEVRNAIRDLSADLPQLVGVWLIAESMPLIWRDENLFAISPSAYKASIYPLVALAGDYYASFDAQTGGFTEVEGATRGRGRGDSYRADLWGAALVPVAGWGEARSQVVDFFDRNNALTEKPPTARKLLYSDTFGFTSRLPPRIDASAYFSSNDTVFLGPNSCEELSGFSSYYNVMVHKQGADFVPSGSSGCLTASGSEQQTELEQWVAKSWFANQAEFRKIGDDRSYYFSLLIQGESLPLQTIREAFAASLPSLACGAGDCFVYVGDTYFADNAGINVDGRWNSFPDQMAAFQTLYSTTLVSGEILYSFITTHGGPDNHYFGISSSVVHDSSFSSLVYELQACSTADLAASEVNIAGTYLFFGNAQAVSGYAQPSLLQCTEGDCFDYMHFLQIQPGGLVIDALFDRNYSMHVYFGDPLLVLP